MVCSSSFFISVLEDEFVQGEVWIYMLTSGRLAINAFKEVLGKRQSGYKDVLGWLDTRIARLR